MTVLWQRTFETLRPFHALPRLLLVAKEEQRSASYHHEGRRRDETHCLLKCTLGGEGIFRDASGEHRIATGEGFICRVADAAIAYYYPADAREPWRFIYACFDGPSAVSVTDEMIARHGPRLVITPDMLGRLASWRRGDAHRVLEAVEGATFVLELLLGAFAAHREAKGPKPQQRLVRRACALIDANIESPINASEVAHQLDVSREHLTRVFSQELGTTPGRFIARRKVRLACQLLKHSPLAVKEVAATLGHSSASHFVHLFKREVGMTPTRFREVGIVPVS